MYGFDFDASRLPASSYTGGPPPRERWRPPRKLIATVAAVALAWGIYANPSDENSESALDDIASSSFEAGAGCAGAIADMVSGKDSDKLRGCSNDPKSPLSLNIYGETIPSTNYKVPKEKVVFVAQDGNDKNPGTKDQPLGSINAALERSPEKGGTVVIRGGMYRQGNARTGKSVTIQNYPKEQVWLDGTDSIPKEQWRQDSEGKYYIDWSTPDFCGGDYYDQPLKAQRQDNKGPCAHKDMSLEADNTMAVDPQMAYKNGINLPEVERYDQATGDNFYYDHGNRRVVLGFNPGKAKMEVTKRASALILAGPGSVVRGIGVQRYATNEYYGNLTNTAVYMAGRDSTIENMVFRKMAGQALYISPKGGTVNHSVLASNGFNGMGSNGSMNGDQSVDGLKVLNSAIFNNNTENFGEKKCTLSCAQSGIKIAHVNQFLIQNNIL
ncbi:MAG TPA: hypothetical protein VF598_09940, partial [Hymenobacter sp.]